MLVHCDLSTQETQWLNDWHTGLKINLFGFEPGWHHCVVFLGKSLYSYNASLHSGVMCTWEFNAGGNPAMD